MTHASSLFVLLLPPQVACGVAATALLTLGMARLLEATSKGKKGPHMPGASRPFAGEIYD